jgi:hypothetical protein
VTSTDSILFPTTHVHDGKLPVKAHFDHSLYAQFPGLIAELSNWAPSHGLLGSTVHATRALGLVDGTAGGHTTMMLGEAPNGDVWFRPPRDVTIDDMFGSGPSYVYRVRATYFYATQSHHVYPKWRDTTAHKLPTLCRGIRTALAEVTQRNERAWQLAPHNNLLTPYFMNGNQLWKGTDYRTGKFVPEPDGPGRVAFRPFSNLVEPQDVELAFATLPSQEDANDIHRELCRMLDRVASS